LVSYAVESVRRQYERYPYPSYTKGDVEIAANWLTQRGLKTERVIDVGCGTGLWAIAFAVNGSEVTAVDFSKASLSMAAEMADKLGVSIDFSHSDLFSFQSSQKYGIVFATEFFTIRGTLEQDSTRSVSLLTKAASWLPACTIVFPRFGWLSS